MRNACAIHLRHTSTSILRVGIGIHGPCAPCAKCGTLTSLLGHHGREPESGYLSEYNSP